MIYAYGLNAVEKTWKRKRERRRKQCCACQGYAAQSGGPGDLQLFKRNPHAKVGGNSESELEVTEVTLSRTLFVEHMP